MTDFTVIPIATLFRRLLTATWLRPERALWDAHELAAVGALLGGALPGPSLEYGCTDGVNTFILLGGEFAPAFDDYRDVLPPAAGTATTDYFDSVKAPDEATAAIQTPPGARFDLGVSWRESHLVKAARLQLYRETRCLPLGPSLGDLPRGHFATIWAPNIFWVEADELLPLLREMAARLRPGGRLLTIFPDAAQRGVLLGDFAEYLDPQWLADLDRGKYANLTRHARTLPEWDGVFAQAGLARRDHRPFLPLPVSQVYDIGLRPLFPAFMDIYETLRRASEADLLRVKAHWLETVYELMAPLCDTSWMTARGLPPLWHAFALERVEERR
jgi:SAM-dependent methyltransferase